MNRSKALRSVLIVPFFSMISLGRASAGNEPSEFDVEQGEERAEDPVRQIQSVEVSRRPQAPAGDRTARRGAAGGRDEQELKPQSTLPAPSRTVDGSGAPVTSTRAEPPPD